MIIAIVITTIHVHSRHLLLLVRPILAHVGWKGEFTGTAENVCSPCQRLFVTVAVVINATACGGIRSRDVWRVRVRLQSFEQATVMFSTLIGFTELCARCSPATVAVSVNSVFDVFDRTVDCHNVFKASSTIYFPYFSSFPYFFVSGPRARLSWPPRQLLSSR